MTTTEALRNLLAAQGREPRQGQIDAAELIDTGVKHVALQAPTGVGKSALAIAASVAKGGGVVAMHSNGLIAQYAAEFASWEAATGKRIASLVGKAHYWCRVADPNLDGLTPAQQVHVRNTGSFIGAGIEQRDYVGRSVAALSPVVDPEDELETEHSPCKECPLRATSCPLWAARSEAARADVVVTNATMLGVALSGNTTWAAGILKKVIVLDEAHADVEPIAAVLGSRITLRDQRAFEGLSEALDVVHELSDDEGKLGEHARRFLARLRQVRKQGKNALWSIEEPQRETDVRKAVLTIPADLRAVFAPHRVIALSATLSQRNVEHLGLDATVESLQGLDVSASRVFVDEAAPQWAWRKRFPAEHAAWAAYAAQRVTAAFRNGGATLALFVSKDDLSAVVALLPQDVQRAALHYYGGTDRTAAIETYRADPKNHLLVGCIAGAGTGVNLPGDLLRTVILTRVPQNCPQDTDRATWAEDTRAAVVQSVGRAHRFDGDWGHVHVLGGFGHRKDVRKSLDDLGWVIE